MASVRTACCVICAVGLGAIAALSVAMAEVGLASYYAHHGRTASGERFDPNALTAAHRTLPFGTRVRVKVLKTGHFIDVRINDRGPFVRSRIIDLSFSAAKAVGLDRSGTAKVEVVVLQ